ncbi:hypothetical protein ACLI4Q_05680 [Natrialbaceae archaeon A-CW1-1]
MDEKDLLKTEIRAVREELVRRDLGFHPTIDGASLLVPPRDVFQSRLKELTDDQLKEHDRRLTRDLEDLEVTDPSQLYRPTEDVEED